MSAEPESYRNLLAEQTGGETEVRLLFGRCDVLTGTHVFEVEPTTSWRTGAGQALQYASQLEQQGALALYGNPAVLPRVWSDLVRLAHPGLELWWFSDGVFVPIRSYDHASSYVPPAPEPEPEPELPALASLFPAAEPVRGEEPDPLEPEPEPQYNSLGLEVWRSAYLPNGQLRPELRGLSTKEHAEVMTSHWPDLGQEQTRQLGQIIQFGQESAKRSAGPDSV